MSYTRSDPEKLEEAAKVLEAVAKRLGIERSDVSGLASAYRDVDRIVLLARALNRAV